MDRHPRAAGRQRVLFLLKTKGPQTAATLARRLGVTTMAVRQHLATLAGEKLVDFTDERRKVGRPARLWRLMPGADDWFPDRHAALAAGLLEAVRAVLGEPGLERVCDETTRREMVNYRARMPGPEAPFAERVVALARLRREDGYLAELRRLRDGGIELVENHCSIAEAARCCPHLCVGELALLRGVLGDAVSVERTEHALGGGRSCTYRLAERA